MIPKIIFIVPYRNREQQQHIFNIYIQHILEDYPKDYCKVYFVEQNYHHKNFNRGAVKNIGFLAIKEKYPNDYKNITFVFNDVDTLPYKKNIIHFETTKGVIKHFYGKHFALGGIFSINGDDFEKIGGFPNYWTWGHEDVVIVKRVEKHHILIDRSVFFELGNSNIMQFNNEKTRNVDISTAFVDDDYLNTYKIIMNLKYTFYDNNNEFYGNFIYIDNFDLALEKNIYTYVIDLKKGEEYHKTEFGKIKQHYKKKYGERKVYYLNKNLENAKQHLIDNNIDLSFLNNNQPRANNQAKIKFNKQERILPKSKIQFKMLH